MNISTITPAQQLGLTVTSLVQAGDLGAALIAAERGWRDYPTESLGSRGATFEQLAVGIASRIPGRAAAPAVPGPEASQAETDAWVAAEVAKPVGARTGVGPVSGVPLDVVAAPVSAVPASAVPASAVPASAVPMQVPVVIERTGTDGTIIRLAKGMPMLKDILMPLGWGLARRGFFYASDRDTEPNMGLVRDTIAALEAAGIYVTSSVRGDEPARPVSAVPASAVPAATRKPTRRERSVTRNAPVTVRQISAPPAPVSAPPAAPVSAPAAPVGGDMLAAMMQQMQAMQQQIIALATGTAPAAPAPVSAPPASVLAEVSVSAVPDSNPAADLDAMIANLVDERLDKVRELTWMFKVAQGASAQKTVKELRSVLAERVGSWWPAQRRGSVTFGAFVDNNHARVIHVRVKAVGGDVTAGTLTAQVKGVALTVHGVGGVAIKSDLV